MSNQPLFNTLYNAAWDLQDRILLQSETDYADQETQQRRLQILAECQRIARAIDQRRMRAAI
jgi:hypothetical protein